MRTKTLAGKWAGAILACLVALSAGVGARAQGAQPDLTVKSHTRLAGSVKAVIANIGRAGAPIRTTATLYLNVSGRGPVSADQSIPALAAGAEVTLTFDLPATPGATYQIMVDSKRELAESDETNNRTPNASADAPASPAVAAIKAPTGPITAAAVPGIVKMAPAHDAALDRKILQRRPMRWSDGSPRPLAGARTPDGLEMLFVENELIVTAADPAAVDAFAARYNGKVLKKLDRKDAGGSTYIVRIDTAKTAQPSLSSAEAQTVFSSDASRNLLLISKAEQRPGFSIGVNLLSEDDSLSTGSTDEGGGKDGLSLDYMQAGGTYDVDVAAAWHMLQLAGKTIRNRSIAIFDGGFGLGQGNYMSKDLVIAGSYDAQGANKSTCTNGSACPYHGLQVAQIAAGIPDDGRLAIGTGGPVSNVFLRDRGDSDIATTLDRIDAVQATGANIINMSFGGEAPRDDSFWEGAWSNAVQKLEVDTIEMANDNQLVFASSGNVGKNVDSRNGDGDENIWFWPCENQGVICVGGWNEDASYSTKGGVPAKNSNYSYDPGGETVDIYGPWCALTGMTPANTEPGKWQTPCGTSMSSPMVAGVAALIWAANPKMSAAQVWGLMAKHSIDAGTIRRVHAREAVREALIMTGVNYPPDVQVPGIEWGKKFPPAAQITLTHKDFDIEDGNGCCAAQWFFDDKLIFSLKPNVQAPVLSLLGYGLGNHKLRIVVTDSKGLTGTWSSAIEIVNAAPKVVVTPMADPMYLNLPYTFRANVSDDSFPLNQMPAAECAKVTWFAPTDIIPVKPTGCVTTITFANSGTFALTAAYIDSLGTQGFGTANVTINGLNAKLGVAVTAPTPGRSYAPQEAIPYAATAVNAKGKVIYAWTLTDVKGAVTKALPIKIGGGTPTFTLLSLFPGHQNSTGSVDYKLTVTATDESGATAQASVIVTQMGFIK